MKSLDGFNIKVEIPVAWGDMDAFKHVNNTRVFRYFETARIKYFEKIGFIETMEKDSIGPILASTSAKFIKPLFYPDTVTVGTRVTSVEPTQFIMEYIVESKSKGIAALGESKMVVYDYESSKRTTLPDIVRNKIKEIDSI
ncbi:MAG: acyl-CoA thioesterase [Candidatus Hermodarchaeota archaeon]